ncbi:hypothetical protein Z945_1768 [Sulfitobacter noctilucae]|nr:hypothetical protein Z945_1768 [Sulfitobacter noctilucae]
MLWVSWINQPSGQGRARDLRGPVAPVISGTPLPELFT